MFFALIFMIAIFAFFIQAFAAIILFAFTPTGHFFISGQLMPDIFRRYYDCDLASGWPRHNIFSRFHFFEQAIFLRFSPRHGLSAFHCRHISSAFGLMLSSPLKAEGRLFLQVSPRFISFLFLQYGFRRRRSRRQLAEASRQPPPRLSILRSATPTFRQAGFQPESLATAGWLRLLLRMSRHRSHHSQQSLHSRYREASPATFCSLNRGRG